jgi:hypothetical protein
MKRWVQAISHAIDCYQQNHVDQDHLTTSAILLSATSKKKEEEPEHPSSAPLSRRVVDRSED